MTATNGQANAMRLAALYGPRPVRPPTHAEQRARIIDELGADDRADREVAA